MKAQFELTDEDIKRAVVNYIENRIGVSIDEKSVSIQSQGGYFGPSVWKVYPLRAVFNADPKGLR